MKIVHVIPRLLKGGAERLVIDICNELQLRENIEVRLVVFSEENLYKEITHNITIVNCPVKYKLSISGKSEIDISSYETFINFFKPDIIHSHLFEAEMVTREITHDKIAYFTHLHDNMPQFERGSFSTLLNKEKLTNFYERKKLLNAYKKCNNQFLSISKSASNYFTRNLPKSLNNIRLLPNAINTGKFTKPTNWKEDRTYDILRLVTVGSLVNKKNQIFLVKVVQQLINKGLNPKLYILGDGPNRNQIETSIKENNLEQYISLKGNVDNVEEYLWKSDIYVHSATYEPFGLVILEAMAAGLPSVCIDGGGNRDILTNEENGFIVEKGNTELFTDYIIRLNKDKDTYKNIVENGLLYAKKHDIGNYVTNLISIYNSRVSS